MLFIQLVILIASCSAQSEQSLPKVYIEGSCAVGLYTDLNEGPFGLFENSPESPLGYFSDANTEAESIILLPTCLNTKKINCSSTEPVTALTPNNDLIRVLPDGSFYDTTNKTLWKDPQTNRVLGFVHFLIEGGFAILGMPKQFIRGKPVYICDPKITYRDFHTGRPMKVNKNCTAFYLPYKPRCKK